MSNGYSAGPYRVHGGKYWAMVRVCRDADAQPILAKGGSPKEFSTRGEALQECLNHVLAFMNGRPIRGEIFEAPTPANDARAKAEQLFVGGGRVVDVERVEVAR